MMQNYFLGAFTFLMYSFYEISYTQQITLQVLRIKLFGFFFNKLEFKYRET